MRDSDRIAILVHRLASTYGSYDLPWQELDPQDLLAVALDDIATVAEAMSCGGKASDIVADIGSAVTTLGMLADTIERNGTSDSKIVSDVRELGEWLVQTAPEELGHDDDENIVQTALRLLKRQYEDTKH